MKSQKNKSAASSEKKSSGKAGTIVGIILCVILIPILIVNVTMIIKGLATPEKVPTFGGYSPLIVLTDSMYPNIKSGDLIIVQEAKASEIQVNDIISFFDPESDDGTSVVTHRVVAVLPDGSFTTKGDANNTEDEVPVPAGNLVGVYKTRIPGAGDVAMFLQTTPGFFVCVGVPLVLLVGYELIRRRKYEKANKQDTDALLAELEALRAQAAKSAESSEESKPNEE